MSIDTGWDNPAFEVTETPTSNGTTPHTPDGGTTPHLSDDDSTKPKSSDGGTMGLNGVLTNYGTTNDDGENEGDVITDLPAPKKVGGFPTDERHMSTVSGVSTTMLVTKEDEDDVKCGWLGFRPDCLQCFYAPAGFLFFLCVFVFAQSMVTNGFVYVVTSTLERRFSLSSAKSGAISSTYDFTIMAIVVFVTYFGEKGHKPMWLGVGATLFGVGSWIFTFPHFFSENYNPGVNAFDETCPINQTLGGGACYGDDQNLSRYYWYFILAQILHGFGSCSIYTHGQTFIYNNVTQGTASMYIGIIMAVSTFAPACGYIFGAMFLSIYTDITKRDEAEIEPSSPLWVGAWWIGFLAAGVIALLVSVPLMGFPRHLQGWKKVELERENTAQEGSDFKMQAGFEGSLRDFPYAVYNLIKNIPLMCINLAVSAENMIVASVAVFGPKYIESMFSISSMKAALIVGFAVFPTSLLGCLLGGWLIKRFKWLYRGQLRMVIFSLVVSWVCMLMLLLTCPNLPFAGVTVDYSNITTDLDQDEVNLTATCNNDCLCGNEYDPVCGDYNNIIYYSACHAGCTEVDDTKKIFSDCHCIPKNDVTSSGGSAEQGRCEYPMCNIAAPFLLCVIIVLFTSLLIIVPSVTMLYAVVSPDQRTTAMGVQSLMYRAFGTVPGPIIFGHLIDKACLIWEESECDDGRVCWLYDNSQFGSYAFTILFSCRFASICFFVLAYVFYKPTSEAHPQESVANITFQGYGSADLPAKHDDGPVVTTAYETRQE